MLISLMHGSYIILVCVMNLFLEDFFSTFDGSNEAGIWVLTAKIRLHNPDFEASAEMVYSAFVFLHEDYFSSLCDTTILKI